MVVLADADLDAAADAASFGAFMNSGQICMSTERIVVDRAVADELGARLAERAGKLDGRRPARPGHDDRPGRQRRRARARSLELIEDARAKGAEVLAGGDADGNVHRADRARRRHARRCGSTARSRSGRSSRIVRGRRRRRGGAGRQRHRVRPRRPRCSARDVAAALDVARRIESRHLPRQRLDRARRAADAVRRRQGLGLGALRRQRGARGVHRAALDERPADARATTRSDGAARHAAVPRRPRRQPAAPARAARGARAASPPGAIDADELRGVEDAAIRDVVAAAAATSACARRPTASSAARRGTWTSSTQLDGISKVRRRDAARAVPQRAGRRSSSRRRRCTSTTGSALSETIFGDAFDFLQLGRGARRRRPS